MIRILSLCALLGLSGCHDTAPRDAREGVQLRAFDLSAAEPATIAGEPRAGALAVTHVGVGSKPSVRDAAERGAKRALAVLAKGEGALEAAVASTTVLEDDPRTNAGVGSNIRLDGRTIQMDATVMSDDGRFAAVGVIERVKNPVQVARKVLETPHLFLAGAGATRFAHRAGFADEVPTCPEAEAKYQRRMKTLKAHLQSGREGFDWARYWNFPGPLPAGMETWKRGGDTVGSVVRDPGGRFAATLSTGGTSVTLHGRVGDVPVFGAGLYAGPAGAVACTGHGEQIIRSFVARSVYRAMERGQSARAAVRAACLAFPKASSVGIIAVDRSGFGVAANRRMAWGLAASP
jgi:L-asparaginase / beta-aspartyl-peptidase